MNIFMSGVICSVNEALINHELNYNLMNGLVSFISWLKFSNMKDKSVFSLMSRMYEGAITLNHSISFTNIF